MALLQEHILIQLKMQWEMIKNECWEPFSHMNYEGQFEWLESQSLHTHTSSLPNLNEQMEW